MLFNKSSNGASEMKSLLGFIYATKSFENMINLLSCELSASINIHLKKAAALLVVHDSLIRVLPEMEGLFTFGGVVVEPFGPLLL